MRAAICLAAALLVTTTVAGCAGSGPRFDKVILVSVDTLRADHLGAYGAPSWITPAIDEFAAGSSVFEDAITQATSTLPAHTSLLYSLHTFVHRAYTQHPPLAPGVASPVETLREAGFRTAAYVGGGQLMPVFGLNRGFETYEVVDTRNINAETRGTDRLAGLLEAGSRFMRRHRDEPFFLFLHTYEPHYPYNAPQQFVDETAAAPPVGGGAELDAPLREFEIGLGVPEDAWRIARRRDGYAAEVRYVDDFFGRLMRRVDNLGLADEVVVVLVSDHGESLGERGTIGHNLFTREQVQVPLLFRVPGSEPRRVAHPVQLIDVMPTLFTMLGVAPPFPFMGNDLGPIIRGGDPDTADEVVRVTENKGGAAVLRGPWKVVFDLADRTSFELFNLVEDPGELDDRADDRPQLALELIGQYDRLTATHRGLPALFPRLGDEQQLDPDTVRQLRALGYIR